MIEIILFGFVIGGLAAGMTHVVIFKGSPAREELNGHLGMTVAVAFLAFLCWASIPSGRQMCGLEAFFKVAPFLLALGAVPGYLMTGLGIWGARGPEPSKAESQDG